jgi:hypothetical protein
MIDDDHDCDSLLMIRWFFSVTPTTKPWSVRLAFDEYRISDRPSQMNEMSRETRTRLVFWTVQRESGWATDVCVYMSVRKATGIMSLCNQSEE